MIVLVHEILFHMPACLHTLASLISLNMSLWLVSTVLKCTCIFATRLGLHLSCTCKMVQALSWETRIIKEKHKRRQKRPPESTKLAPYVVSSTPREECKQSRHDEAKKNIYSSNLVAETQHCVAVEHVSFSRPLSFVDPETGTWMMSLISF